jgi:hypothetical protein
MIELNCEKNVKILKLVSLDKNYINYPPPPPLGLRLIRSPTRHLFREGFSSKLVPIFLKISGLILLNFQWKKIQYSIILAFRNN